MAFQAGSTGAMQTAYNVAATLTAAMVEGGILTDTEVIETRFEELAQTVFASLKVQVEQDNALFKAEGNSTTSPKTWSQNRTPRVSDAGNITVEGDGGDLVLKFGAFKGESISTIAGYNASQCADHGYGSGDKTGKQYIEWLAGKLEKDPNGPSTFAAKHAAAYLAR